MWTCVPCIHRFVSSWGSIKIRFSTNMGFLHWKSSWSNHKHTSTIFRTNFVHTNINIVNHIGRKRLRALPHLYHHWAHGMTLASILITIIYSYARYRISLNIKCGKNKWDFFVRQYLCINRWFWKGSFWITLQNIKFSDITFSGSSLYPSANCRMFLHLITI